jgi:hypothetical protein
VRQIHHAAPRMQFGDEDEQRARLVARQLARDAQEALVRELVDESESRRPLSAGTLPPSRRVLHQREWALDQPKPRVLRRSERNESRWASGGAGEVEEAAGWEEGRQLGSSRSRRCAPPSPA